MNGHRQYQPFKMNGYKMTITSIYLFKKVYI